MSYILDALRKSDQLRQRGATPTLQSAPVTVSETRKPALLMYGVPAIILLATGLSIGWLRPWQPEQPGPATHGVVVRPAESGPHQDRVSARIVVPEMNHASPAETYAGLAPAAATPLQEAAMAAEAHDPTPTQVVVVMENLPLSIRQELPEMVVSLHAYARKPGDRLVSINNQLLREGGNPAPGVKLEQITPDGMILSYKGYRFQRGVR